jgi:hypothetical protein
MPADFVSFYFCFLPNISRYVFTHLKNALGVYCKIFLYVLLFEGS